MTKITMVLTPHQYQTLLMSLDLAAARQGDIIHAITDEQMAPGGDTLESRKAKRDASAVAGRIADLKATILNG